MSFREVIINRLNNISLNLKFFVMFVCCVILPLTLSCVIFSFSLNKYFYRQAMEMADINAASIHEKINKQIESVVNFSNMLASNGLITYMSEHNFSDTTEYYGYIMENDLISYLDTYYVQQPYIQGLHIYLTNDTILNGGVIANLDNKVKAQSWYKDIVSSDDITTVCAGQNLKDSDTGLNSSRSSSEMISVVRKISKGIGAGSLLGCIKIDLSMEDMRGQMLINEAQTKIYLANNKSDLVYDPSANEFVRGVGDFVEELRDSGYIIRETEFDNAQYMDDWTMISTFDTKDVTKQQIKNTIIVILINLLVGLFMVGVVLMIYQSFSDRIKKIVQSMVKIENVNYKNVEFKRLDFETGSDEIGVMAQEYNHMIDSLNALINDVYVLEIKNKNIEVEKTRAELKYLQSQIDPHFIFNVLNTMLIVSIKNGYTDLVEQISSFAKLMRRLVDYSEDYEPLSKEMEFVNAYVKLEEFRFKGLFTYEINMDENSESCMIPKMIVQPIVENACRHGLQKKSGQRRLKISTSFKDNVLTITVADNGTGMDIEKLEQLRNDIKGTEFEGHIGMKNVYRRLKFYFDGKADLVIDSEEGKGTEIKIIIDYGDDEEETSDV